MQHELGISWVGPGAIARAAHAVADGGRVWLIDPFDDTGALEAAAQLGQPAAVIQLLDRHNRDCQSIAFPVRNGISTVAPIAPKASTNDHTTPDRCGRRKPSSRRNVRILH